MLARLSFLIALSFAALVAFAGERRVILLLDEGAAIRQAANSAAASFTRGGLQESAIGQFEITDSDRAASLAARLRHDNSEYVVVALGPKTLRPALQIAGGRPIVAAFVSKATMEESGYPLDRITAVVLDQPPDRLLNLVQAAQPNVRQVGLLVGPTSVRQQRPLERRAQERRIVVATETVATGDELLAALERLVTRSQLLLAVPDPVVHNRNTILPLLLATYRAGIPVVGYSEAYLQAGAAISLYSTPAQIGQQVAEITLNAFDERSTGALLSPKYFTVEVNMAVLRSLGLVMPPVAEIQERVRSQE